VQGLHNNASGLRVPAPSVYVLLSVSVLVSVSPGLPDIERLNRKLEAQRASLADLCQLYRASSVLPRLEEAVRCHEVGTASHCACCMQSMPHFDACVDCACLHHVFCSCCNFPQLLPQPLVCRTCFGGCALCAASFVPFSNLCVHPCTPARPQGAAAELLVSRYATPLSEHHDDAHLTKFELLLEASLDLEAVPHEYLISAAYDSRLQVRGGVWG
jgi:hypothetical protein